jgi:thiosulfate/3-mercaptopyruvate sulfurtransferase
VFAKRGGHIPGAVNIEWTDAMDKQHDLRLKPENELRQLLESKGITPDKMIVMHCQTHHRSAHTYILLKSLGYEKIKGYPGSWSDWGNEPNTPIE